MPGCWSGSSSCAGGDQARIVLVTTATRLPEEVLAEYERVFRKLGVEQTSELRLRGRGDADGDDAAALLSAPPASSSAAATSPGCAPWSARATNDILSERLADGLVVGGHQRGRHRAGPHDDPWRRRAPTSRPPRSGPGPASAWCRSALIDMHFGERGRLPRLLSAVALDPEHLGIGLDENTGVLVDGDGFEVIGTGVATVVDAEDATVVHAAGDCDPITLFGVRLHLLPAGCLFDFGTRTPAIGPAHNRY